MPLIQNTYGKGRVRVMRVFRDGLYNEVRETSAMILLQGDFAAAYTEGDNRQVVATDTIKNIAYIVGREHIRAGTEAYGTALAQRFLDRYPQVAQARVVLPRNPLDPYARPRLPARRERQADRRDHRHPRRHQHRFGHIRLHLHEKHAIRLGRLRVRRLHDAAPHP